jgi:hypothetical protein
MGMFAPIMAVVGLAGSLIGAAGQEEAAQAQAEAAAYQATVAANNAAIAKQNANLDIQAGETAATNEGLKTRAQVGAETAGFGASGVDAKTGSPAAVTAGTREIGYLDALTLRSNAAKQAFSQEVQGTSQQAQSGLARMESSQAGEAGQIGAASSLLSGVSTVGKNYAMLQNTGGGSSIYGPFAGIGLSNPGDFGVAG